VQVVWEVMRQRLLERVFYNFSEEDVAASTDLVGDGYLDSLSVLVILASLDEELGDELAVQYARVPDTASLDAIGGLYRRLLAQIPSSSV
jgi:acyl carrier protein